MEMLRYFTWLSEAIPKGNLAVNRILDRYDTPKAFYEAFVKNPNAIDFLPPYIKTRIEKTPLSKADTILNRCEETGISVVCPFDPLYPKRLLDIDGIPPVLYYVGDISELDTQPSLGVVGKRKCISDSMRATAELSAEVARAGINIISGCAEGVDAHAHIGALEVGGRTVGVLGCGVDVNYPQSNSEIKNQMLQNGGALISEQPPGTPGHRQNFPPRNRIIAGLSDAVFVTEAPKRSGSLITARHALEQGKDVFCLVPLDFYSWRYAGNVEYLRDGAIPVYGAYDILHAYYRTNPDKMDMNSVLRALDADEREKDPPADKKQKQGARNHPSVEPKPAVEKQPLPDVSADAQTVYSALSETPVHIEQLITDTALSMPQLLSALTELELAGVLTELPGKQYTVK